VNFFWRQSSIDELKGDWNNLVLKTQSPNFFSSWEWVRAWWQVYGKHKELRTWAFYGEDHLLGIAPLCLKGKTVSFLGTGVSDRLDFIIQEGYEEAFIKGFLRTILQDESWDLLDLQEIPSLSPTIFLWKKFYPDSSYTARVQSKLPYLNLPESWDAFLGRYSKKRRDKIKYYPKLLDRHFLWKIEEVPESQLKKELNSFFKLHLDRFRSKFLPTPVLLPNFRSFHKLLAQEENGQKRIKLYILHLNGKPAAALYGFQFAGRFYFYLSGQDERYHKYGLGYVLQIYALKDSLSNGLSCFDFLKGLESYKLHWKPNVNESMRIIARRSTLRSKILYDTKIVEHEVTQYVKRKAGRI